MKDYAYMLKASQLKSEAVGRRKVLDSKKVVHFIQRLQKLLNLRPLPNPRLTEIVGSLNLDFFQLPAKTVVSSATLPTRFLISLAR